EEKNQKDVGGTIAAAYYYYSNVTGVLNTTNVPNSTTWSAPLYEQYGNTLFLIDPTNNLYVGLASKFEELNINGDIDVGFWDPVHIILMGDYVKNLGFNNAAVQQLVGPGVTERTVSYQVGLTVGYPVIEKFAQWNVSLNYKFLGGDAVIDAFTDPDFHLGGTNAKGWILGAQFGLAKNAWLRLRYLTADQIAGPPLAIDVLQLDFNARF
ncbi:MAG: putative porin, partial [Dissulfurispiraceae bacterium]